MILTVKYICCAREKGKCYCNMWDCESCFNLQMYVIQRENTFLFCYFFYLFFFGRFKLNYIQQFLSYCHCHLKWVLCATYSIFYSFLSFEFCWHSRISHSEWRLNSSKKRKKKQWFSKANTSTAGCLQMCQFAYLSYLKWKIAYSDRL